MMTEDSFIDAAFEDRFDDTQEDWEDESEESEDDFDGQPDEYQEWQDFYGGDDWDHGQFDNEF